MIYLTLFIEFFKVGLFAIGGGLATLPFLYELAEKYPWYTPQMLTDMVAVSESTPGAIGINMSTYAGYHAGGILGGIIATLSLTLPSIIIIMIVAKILDKFSENAYVQSAFATLRPAVVGLIAAAGYQIFKVSVIHLDIWEAGGTAMQIFDIKAIILFVALFIGITKIKTHPIVFIGIGAAVGIVLRM